MENRVPFMVSGVVLIVGGALQAFGAAQEIDMFAEGVSVTLVNKGCEGCFVRVEVPETFLGERKEDITLCTKEKSTKEKKDKTEEKDKILKYVELKLCKWVERTFTCDVNISQYMDIFGMQQDLYMKEAEEKAKPAEQASSATLTTSLKDVGEEVLSSKS